MAKGLGGKVAQIAGMAAALVAFDAAAQQRMVNVYNWSDYIAADAVAKFTKETGVKVNYDVYDSNEVVEAKLTAGKAGYDIVVPTSSPFVARQIPAGFYQKLDKSKLKNYGNLDPEIMKRLAAYDPGNEYGVPWMWGTSGIGYNVDKVKKAMPDAPVYSLSLLFDPAIVSKFKSCGVMMLDSPTDVIPAALKYLGLDPDSKKTEDLDKAAEAVLKIRPYVRKFHSSEYIDRLANGDICIAFGFSGDVIQASNRANEAKKGVKVAYSIPTEGALFWVDTMVIPKDAPNPDLAHLWIDFMLKPEIAASSSDFVGYANGNKAAFPLVSEEVRNNPSVYPPAEVMARLYTLTPADRDYERARTRAWTRIKTGR